MLYTKACQLCFPVHRKAERGTPDASPSQIRCFLVVVLAVRVAAGTVLAAVVCIAGTVLRVVLVVLVLLLLILLAVLVKIVLRHSSIPPDWFHVTEIV